MRAEFPPRACAKQLSTKMAMLRRVGLSAEPLLRNGGLSTRLSSIRLCTSGTVPADSGAVSASGPQPLQRLPNGQWPELRRCLEKFLFNNINYYIIIT